MILHNLERKGPAEKGALTWQIEPSAEKLTNEAATLRTLARRVQALEQEINQRTRELEHARRVVYNIVYLASHNFRGPLRWIHGYSSLLDQHLCANSQSYTQRIRCATERLEQMLQGLIAYGRLAVGHYPLSRVNPDPLLRQAAEKLRNGQVGAEARLVIQPSSPEVWANPRLLGLVFMNLLTNAFKFTSPGVAPHVVVTHEKRLGAVVRFSVQDHGLGVVPEVRQQLFGPLHALFACSKFGAGLGLLQVQAAAERLNAVVGVQSTPAQGSCFWIELPENAPGTSP